MDDRTDLDAAYAVRREARLKLAAATQALDRGGHVLRDAEAELAAAQRAMADVMAAHAAKLQRSITDGAAMAPPPLMLDDQPRRTAETRVAIASTALQALVAQHATAQAALQAADVAVAARATAILDIEAHDLAAKIAKHHAVLLRLGEQLRGYLPSGMVQVGYSPPEFIADALSLVPLPNPIHVPINQMGPRADFAGVAERRRALIAGEDADAGNDAAAA